MALKFDICSLTYSPEWKLLLGNRNQRSHFLWRNMWKIQIHISGFLGEYSQQWIDHYLSGRDRRDRSCWDMPLGYTGWSTLNLRIHVIFRDLFTCNCVSTNTLNRAKEPSVAMNFADLAWLAWPVCIHDIATSLKSPPWGVSVTPGCKYQVSAYLLVHSVPGAESALRQLVTAEAEATCCMHYDVAWQGTKTGLIAQSPASAPKGSAGQTNVVQSCLCCLVFLVFGSAVSEAVVRCGQACVRDHASNVAQSQAATECSQGGLQILF